MNTSPKHPQLPAALEVHSTSLSLSTSTQEELDILRLCTSLKDTYILIPNKIGARSWMSRETPSICFVLITPSNVRELYPVRDRDSTAKVSFNKLHAARGNEANWCLTNVYYAGLVP
jgi:hypothetical protein